MKRSRVILVEDDKETDRKHPFISEDDQNHLHIDIEGIVFRCIEWMTQHPQHLPVSYDEIHSLLGKFCHQTLEIDCQVIFGQLLLNNVIALTESQNVVAVEPRIRQAKGEFQVFVPTDATLFDGTHLPDTTSRKISADFIRTLSRAISWIQSGLAFQSKEISLPLFMLQLRQLCIIQLDVSPNIILNHFQLRGIISIDAVGNVSYSLPSKPFKQPHYLPMYCRENQPSDNHHQLNQDIEIL